MKAIISFAFLVLVAVAYSLSEEDMSFYQKLECPIYEEGMNATLLPHPHNCNSYFVCEGGSPTPMKCPEGLHFNPELSVCDYPWRAGCTAKERNE